MAKENKNPKDKKNNSNIENDALKKKVAHDIDWKAHSEALENELDSLKQKYDELEKKNQRDLIEFQLLAKNFQTKAQKQIEEKVAEHAKKMEDDKAHIKKYASQKLVESIIEPILNIELAVQSGKNQEGVAAYVVGFEMLLNQLYSELEMFDIKTIDPKPGDEFDPELHHIMSQVDGGKANTIKELKKKGFKLHDRVLKPATVITFK